MNTHLFAPILSIHRYFHQWCALIRYFLELQSKPHTRNYIFIKIHCWFHENSKFRDFFAFLFLSNKRNIIFFLWILSQFDKFSKTNFYIYFFISRLCNYNWRYNKTGPKNWQQRIWRFNKALLGHITCYFNMCTNRCTIANHWVTKHFF